MSWYHGNNTETFRTVELIVGGILPIVLIVIGTIGNLLCVNYLFQRRQKRTRSAYIYLIFLFLADTLSLLYIFTVIGSNKLLSDQSLFLCRSITFLSFYTLHLSAIFLTLVSIDRTLVLWSRYYRFHMTRRYQASLISLLVFINLFLLDGFLLSFGIIDKSTNDVICYYSYNDNLMNFYDNIYPWIHLIIMYIIPFVIMLFGIILIIIKLCNRRSNPRYSNQKQRLSMILIGLCLVYMILTLPNRLCFSIFFSRLINHPYTDSVLLASNTLLYTRNATNILFLYIGSMKFRRHLAKLFCCFCLQRSSNRVLPIQNVQMIQRTQQF